ncbi:hypothetical protein [Qipengyuania sp.]|uniref:hypothetical protein n=1 Tax=Qipengyuania sp. TaxID=2004515 RepID=UPI003AF894E5
MKSLAFAPVLALIVAAPVAAEKDISPELAESRLNGCLLAGSTAAPRNDLREAVVSVRAFCAPQIKRVRNDRVAAATAGLSGVARKAADDAATRKLNDEIALVIAKYTGLTL